MKIIIPALLFIGLAFAIAMLIGINKHLEQKETANKIEWVRNCNLNLDKP